jgi:hypothetical protein
MTVVIYLFEMPAEEEVPLMVELLLPRLEASFRSMGLEHAKGYQFEK